MSDDTAELNSDIGRSLGGIFISHVHEDKPLADAFSVLIQDVTAGAATAFSSSHASDDTGIRYGTEWFQWIKEKIEECDHVVALLTPQSVGRPWILFEAGLGKAHRDRTVFGLSLGLPVAEASVGPFGVFQNSSADPTSVAKLCKQVIKSCGARPRDEVIEHHVGVFLEAVEAHAAVDSGSDSPSDDPSSAIFQGIEDLKFLVRRLSEGDDRPTRTSRSAKLTERQAVEVLLQLEEMGSELSTGLRLTMLASVARQAGSELVAGLFEGLNARGGSAVGPRSFRAVDRLAHVALDGRPGYAHLDDLLRRALYREMERIAEISERRTVTPARVRPVPEVMIPVEPDSIDGHG